MDASNKDLVVLLHGIGDYPIRMKRLASALAQDGYDALNIGYPSSQYSIEECADFVHKTIEQARPDIQSKIHFVAHSMGGLVTLNLLSKIKVPEGGRAVFLGTPYGGSEVVDVMKESSFFPVPPLFRMFYGPAGQQLTTIYRQSAMPHCPPPSVEIGVIAGTEVGPFILFSGIMKQSGLHDGLVSVESTKMPFMADHISLPSHHASIIDDSIPDILHFLKHGRFIENAPTDATPSPPSPGAPGITAP